MNEVDKKSLVNNQPAGPAPGNGSLASPSGILQQTKINGAMLLQNGTTRQSSFTPAQNATSPIAETKQSVQSPSIGTSTTNSASQVVQGASAQEHNLATGSTLLPNLQTSQVNQASQGSQSSVNANKHANQNFHLQGGATGLMFGNERKPDYFGKHNEELAKKAAKKQEARKIIFRVGIILGIILAVLLVGWFVYWLIFQVILRPDITASSGDEQDTPIAIVEAGKIYDNNPDNQQKVDEYFDKNINSARSEYEKNQTVILQMSFLLNYDDPYEAIIEASKKANVETMDISQIGEYSGMLYNAYSSIEDSESANYWYNYGQEHGYASQYPDGYEEGSL